MSPCPQMRCEKRQGRAHRCCHLCTGAVQDFPLQRKVKVFCSHSFCLRFGAVFPHENSTNKKRPCCCRFSPRGGSVQYNMPQSGETQGVLDMQAAPFTARQPAGVQFPVSPSTADRAECSVKRGHMFNQSCGTVELKFYLNFLNTLWHFNHCWQ